jgi:hypothetical protein
MNRIVASLVVALASNLSVVATVRAAAEPAALRFVDSAPFLAGHIYGIDAVDQAETGYGQRLSTTLTPGLRTVRYTCPGRDSAPHAAHLSFVFEAGRGYELVCGANGEAEVRSADC